MKRIPTSSHSLDTGDEAGENDNYGSVLAAHPGSRRGGQLQTTGSQPIVSVTACPTYVLPEAPVPEQPETLTRPPDTRTPCGDLHAPYNEQRPHRTLNLMPPDPEQPTL